MEKLKAKLLTYKLSLQIYFRYDCQNKLLIIALFPIRDFFKMSLMFFSFISPAVGNTALSLSLRRSKSVGSEK